MAKTAIMIDLETLSTDTDAAILSIGAVKFDPFEDELTNPQMDKFYARISLENDLNLSISDSTLEWWAKQSQEAQDEAFSEENRIDIADAFDQLYKFCWGAKQVWSNGSGFDQIFLQSQGRKPRRLERVFDGAEISDIGPGERGRAWRKPGLWLSKLVAQNVSVMYIITTLITCFGQVN